MYYDFAKYDPGLKDPLDYWIEFVSKSGIKFLYFGESGKTVKKFFLVSLSFKPAFLVEALDWHSGNLFSND